MIGSMLCLMFYVKGYFIMKKNKCVVKGCDNNIYIIKHGICAGHAQQLYRKGKIKNAPLLKRKRHSPLKESLLKVHKFD
jgi:hypothetical protein